MNEETYSIERRQAAQKHLEFVEAMIGGPAYAGWKAGKRAEAAELADQILSFEVRSIEDLISVIKLKEQYKAAVDAIESFETARDLLKAKIQKMLEVEDESRQ